MIVTVDTGGTKTLVTSFDKSGKPGEYFRFPTPVIADEYAATLTEFLHDHFAGKKLEGVVIGAPGIIRDNTIVWGGGTLPWENLDIATPVSHALDCPVWIENDANLAGLAETRALKKAPQTSLYITISTGIGSGIVIDGKLSKALGDSEVGHMVLEYDGRLQEWEKFASGKAITKTYGSYAKDIHDLRVWRQIADKIARGFLALLPTLQPDVVIIGGSIGTYFSNYETHLKNLLREKLPQHIILPEIRQAIHPEEAVVYGCYYYAKDKLAR
jgi:predicted NBD/HSP70 family sugar kinase